MSNKLLTVLVLLVAGYGVYWMINYYKQDFEGKRPPPQTAAPADSGVAVGDANIPSESLTGLPENLEPSLKAAYATGPDALGSWLKAKRIYVGDPRLGAIELDYAALLARSDPATAKRIYEGVKRRTASDSPLYARLKKLEAAYR